jgi:hypothetical protein
MTGKKLTFKLLLFVVTTLFLSSCTTGGYIADNFDYPILDIQNTVAGSIPEGVGGVNGNQRVFYSNKFSVKQEKKGKIPLVMRVVINGDRRPYTLEVEVRKVASNIEKSTEAFDQGDAFQGQESLAKRVATSIKDQLTQRRKSKNIFDDFKPF